MNKVLPLETISQIPSANPIFGAISTEPLMICNCASIFCAAKNFSTVFGYEVAILLPAKSFKEFSLASFGTAIDTLHLEKPKRSTKLIPSPFSIKTFSPIIAASTTPSFKY